MEAPSGTWLMTSTPAATTTSAAPAMTAWAAKWAACCDEPHWRSTVVAGTASGQPAASTALRPTLTDWAPACMTHPMTTSSMIPGSIPVRSTRAPRVSAARSAGCHPDSLPLRLPPAVRTASTITAVGMAAAPWSWPAHLTVRSSQSADQASSAQLRAAGSQVAGVVVGDVGAVLLVVVGAVNASGHASTSDSEVYGTAADPSAPRTWTIATMSPWRNTPARGSSVNSPSTWPWYPFTAPTTSVSSIRLPRPWRTAATRIAVDGSTGRSRRAGCTGASQASSGSV